MTSWNPQTVNPEHEQGAIIQLPNGQQFLGEAFIEEGEIVWDIGDYTVPHERIAWWMPIPVTPDGVLYRWGPLEIDQ